jgi:hypothetical protein
VSLVVFGCLWLSLVILVHDSWVNRLVYILRENSNCTEELIRYWVTCGISLFIRIIPQLYVIIHIDPAAVSSIPPYLTILFELIQLCGKASRPASVLSEVAPNVYLLHQIFPRVVAIPLVHIQEILHEARGRRERRGG